MILSRFSPGARQCTPSPRHALGPVVLLALAAGSVLAQTGPQVSGALVPITITGNPLGTDDSLAPVASYVGTGLLLRARSSLGETLTGTPGVSSTYFGPHASRPVIRGLDGDRIRILGNGGASLDASGLSYDPRKRSSHAADAR